MGLETGTYISDLVATNPTATDPKSQGDDHFRLIKGVLQATLPSASKALYFPTAAAKNADFSVVAADQNKLFVITTSGGAVAATLPSLAVGDAGWECAFVKIGTDTNPYFITPPSGTIQSGEYSGLSKTRRCIPGRRTKVFWTGSDFVAERVCSEPIGTVLDNWLAATPVGYEPANGTSLSSAANYPDYNAAKGSLVTPDCTGRVVAGKEAVATRLTLINGATLGATGGEQSHVLIEAELAPHQHAWGGTFGLSINSVGNHTHDYDKQTDTAGTSSGGSARLQNNPTATTTSSSGGHTHTGSVAVGGATDSHGSGSAHNNLQPTIVMPKILVVE